MHFISVIMKLQHFFSLGYYPVRISRQPSEAHLKKERKEKHPAGSFCYVCITENDLSAACTLSSVCFQKWEILPEMTVYLPWILSL